MLFTDREGGATGEEAVQEQTNRQTGETALEPVGQTVEGFEFTVLLGGILAGVLNELGQQGEDEPIVGDQLGLQYRMVVGGMAGVCHRQTMRAVTFGESEYPGAVNSDQEVATTQTIGVEHFSADQRFDTVCDNGLHLCDAQASVGLVEGVAVGTGLDAEQRLELG